LVCLDQEKYGNPAYASKKLSQKLLVLSFGNCHKTGKIIPNFPTCLLNKKLCQHREDARKSS
jgi:hypothetical protein